MQSNAVQQTPSAPPERRPYTVIARADWDRFVASPNWGRFVRELDAATGKGRP